MELDRREGTEEASQSALVEVHLVLEGLRT
jgi:hypothetical protein